MWRGSVARRSITVSSSMAPTELRFVRCAGIAASSYSSETTKTPEEFKAWLDKRRKADKKFQSLVARHSRQIQSRDQLDREKVEDDQAFERRAKVFAARINLPHEIVTPALIHTSWAGRVDGNAQLEFLGDRVLNLLIAEMVSLRYPNAPVWAITEAYHHFISNTHLASVANTLGMEQAMRWTPANIPPQQEGENTEDNKTNNLPSALADCLEAIIASLYKAQGIGAARAFVQQHIFVDDGSSPNIGALLQAKRPKVALSDILSRRGAGKPFYKVLTETGRASHRSTFIVGCFSDDRQIGTGNGRSIALAEANAAHDALNKVWGKKSYDVQPSQREPPKEESRLH